jgi:dienelactone hydrolase
VRATRGTRLPRIGPVMSMSLVAGMLGLVAGCSRTQGAQTQSASREGYFPSGSVQLSYRLDRPAGRPPFPAVVVGHGSGRVTKGEFQVFADGFLQRGFAVLRYDKRGVGKSTGTYSGVSTANSEQTLADLSGDMAAGARFLQAQPDIDRSRIGLMGASQAGWIIPLAAKETNVVFMILASGPTVSVGEEIYYSQFAEGTSLPLDRAYDELTRYTGPRGFDPAPTLAALNVPGLWLLGAVDDSIPERNTIANLTTLIARGRPFAFVEYPNAGHGLTDRTTGVSVALWADIDRWLRMCCPQVYQRATSAR